MFWRELWDYIKRNIHLIVIALVVAVVLPWTLIIIVPLAFILLIPLIIKWRIYRARKQMFDNMKNPSGEAFGGESKKSRKSKRDGNVTVVRTEHSEPRINDEVGEYVDFKEIKEDK